MADPGVELAGARAVGGMRLPYVVSIDFWQYKVEVEVHILLIIYIINVVASYARDKTHAIYNIVHKLTLENQAIIFFNTGRCRNNATNNIVCYDYANFSLYYRYITLCFLSVPSAKHKLSVGFVQIT